MVNSISVNISIPEVSVVVLFVLCLGVYNIFVLLAPYVCFHIFS